MIMSLLASLREGAAARWEWFSINAPWLVVTTVGAVGAGWAGWMVARPLLAYAQERWREWVRRRRNPPRPTYRDVWLRMRGELRETWWERTRAQIERTWRDAGIPLSAATILSIHVLLAAVGAAFGILQLRNPGVALVLAGVGAWLPSQVLKWQLDQARKAIHNDLVRAIHFFATEFAESGHVARSFLRSAQRVPGPIGDIFDRTGHKLQAGENYRAVLGDLEGDLRGHPYGVLFAQVCRIAVEDRSVAPMFATLVVRLQERSVLERRARAAFAGYRTLSQILNLGTVPAVLAGVYLVPSGYQFYTGTPQGQAAMLVASLLIVVSFWFNRAAGRLNDV